MGAVRLGRIGLRWCMNCGLPLVELERCGNCGGPSVPVNITPPGDYRPAFDHDIESIRRTLDLRYGPGSGNAMLPPGHLVVLNKCPGNDILDEVIAGGRVLGSHIFEPGTGWRFICRIEGARRMADTMTKGWAVVDEDAIPFIRKGASAMAAGVSDADPGIETGDEVVVLSPDRIVVSTGKARMSGVEMRDASRGPAVKSRWYKDAPPMPELPGGRTWQDAVRANAETLGKRSRKAITHVRRTAKRFGDLPVAVSISGGKDSLATLLLVLEAGIKPRLMFADTGLEFPETLENVRRTAARYNLELLVEHAGDAFWHALEHFGPPAKDFRWCCKTCKLGPTARLIRKHFPDGVLSFIGQRQYESSQRYEKGNVWRNPWVPGQVGASPIQRWPSLLVWLYLFQQGAEYNPLYEKGMERIGCWLCPATDLGEAGTMERHSDQAERWHQALEGFTAGRGLSEEWLEYGLWRWREPPAGMLDLMRSAGVGMPREPTREMPREEPTAEELGRLERFSRIPGSKEAIRMKALHCVGCGICVSRCEQGALEMAGGQAEKVEIDPDKCNGCGRCLHPCPVVDFPPR